MRMLAQDVDGGWRISLTDVERDGPYSRFAGMTRVSLVMEGAGVTLDDGTMRVELRPGRPSEYDGGATWHATLRDGPVVKLNAMAARGRYRARITPLYEAAHVQTGCFALVVTLRASCIVCATDSTDAIVHDAVHVASRIADCPALDIAPSNIKDGGKVSIEAPPDAPAPYGALVIIEAVSGGRRAADADSLPSKGKQA
ncbi:HutD family protein [Trinickia symbiotica]|nr:HutD family protein [Trinickia symbiotica]